MIIPQSNYDFAQVLKAVLDEPSASLRVLINGLTLTLSHTTDSIRLGDGTNLITSTTIGAKQSLDVNVAGGVVSGNFTSSGLSTDLNTTEITVTDVATKVPSSALLNRNGISVRVWNPLDTSIVVYFGDSTVSVSNGYPKLNKEEIVIDIKDNPAVELYAICETGKSAKVRVFEVS